MKMLLGMGVQGLFTELKCQTENWLLWRSFGNQRKAMIHSMLSLLRFRYSGISGIGILWSYWVTVQTSVWSFFFIITSLMGICNSFCRRTGIWIGKQGIKLPWDQHKVLRISTMTACQQFFIEMSSAITYCWIPSMKLIWQISGWQSWWIRQISTMPCPELRVLMGTLHQASGSSFALLLFICLHVLCKTMQFSIYYCPMSLLERMIFQCCCL